jgi:hypothetical protein
MREDFIWKWEGNFNQKRRKRGKRGKRRMTNSSLLPHSRYFGGVFCLDKEMH